MPKDTSREPTLDELRTFVAIVDAGSFSAAAVRLRRAQSAVSHSIANLENKLELTLWDRSTKVPSLTEQGAAVLRSARRVCEEANSLRSVAGALGLGLEPVVSMVVDSIFPLDVLADAALGFHAEFPEVQLRVQTETLSAASACVAEGRCQFGIVNPDARLGGLVREQLTDVLMVPVVASQHPLANLRGRVSREDLSRHVQIVLTERSNGGPDHAVLSAHTWRVTDLAAKRTLLRAGIGWGLVPESVAAEDLANGHLVRIQPKAWAEDQYRLHLVLIRRPDVALGPAAQSLANQFRKLARKPAPGRAKPKARRRAKSRR